MTSILYSAFLLTWGAAACALVALLCDTEDLNPSYPPPSQSTTKRARTRQLRLKERRQ